MPSSGLPSANSSDDRARGIGEGLSRVGGCARMGASSLLSPSKKSGSSCGGSRACQQPSSACHTDVTTLVSVEVSNVILAVLCLECHHTSLAAFLDADALFRGLDSSEKLTPQSNNSKHLLQKCVGCVQRLCIVTAGGSMRQTQIGAGLKQRARNRSHLASILSCKHRHAQQHIDE